MRSTGRCSRITPVENGSTASGVQPKSFAAAVQVERAAGVKFFPVAFGGSNASITAEQLFLLEVLGRATEGDRHEIAAELRPRVFDDFVQGHNPQRQRREGLGLGLAMLRSLYEHRPAAQDHAVPIAHLNGDPTIRVGGRLVDRIGLDEIFAIDPLFGGTAKPDRDRIATGQKFALDSFQLFLAHRHLRPDTSLSLVKRKEIFDAVGKRHAMHPVE